MPVKKISAKIDPKEQNKAIIAIGYKSYVLPLEDAAQIMCLFEHAQFYETEWHSGEGSTESYTTHHIGTLDPDVFPKMSIMPDSLYHTAVVAGPKE